MVEGHHWFVNDKLLHPLDRGSLGPVEDLDVVFGVYLDSSTMCVGLVERFSNPTVIVVEESSVLHELYASSLKNRATLRPVIHDSDLHGRVGIPDGNGLLDGVIV